jgi:hypothetical protein
MKSAKGSCFVIVFALVLTLAASSPGCAVAHLPTPTPRGLVIDLAEAEEQGLVEADITGRGLDWIDMVLESLTPDPLQLTVEIGTIFVAESSGTQNMVVIQEETVFLEAKGSVEAVVVDVACASMQLHIPDEEDQFTISREPVPDDLLKLLNLPAFQEAYSFVQQFAIWTITDNPPRDGYRGLGYFGVGFPPDDEEMADIRALFEEAGIPTENYQALR